MDLVLSCDSLVVVAMAMLVFAADLRCGEAWGRKAKGGPVLIVAVSLEGADTALGGGEPNLSRELDFHSNSAKCPCAS